MPSNEYYDHTTYPGPNAPGSSAALRAEFDLVEQGFLKLPTLSGNGNKVAVVNAGGTALTATSSLTGLTIASSALTGSTVNSTSIGATTPSTGVFTTLSATSATVGGDTVATLTASQTLTNKTLNLSSNTLVATSAQLASAVSDETGTGSLVFADSPALAGVPTAPTAVSTTNTTQIATTAFVQQVAFASTLPDQTGNNGKYLKTNGSSASWEFAADVTGPASSVNNNIALFDGATGKLIKDSGVALSAKQDALVSGTSIKTVNSTSLLGSGNVAVQATLVSGTNIKTVGGASLLGSGDVGAIGATYGGTGQTTYAVGDILYASTTSALTRLAGVALGNALISGGVSTAPNWGKISLSGTQHVTGTLPVGNGGTGATTLTGIVKGNGTSAFTAATAETDYVTPTGSGTLSGKIITGLRETRVAMGASDISITAGNYFTRTISGTTTLTVSNVPASGTAASFILDLTNGGSATVNWWSGVKWAGGTAPTLTAAGRDVLGFFTHDAGTTWTGLLLAKDAK